MRKGEIRVERPASAQQLGRSGEGGGMPALERQHAARLEEQLLGVRLAVRRANRVVDCAVQLRLELGDDGSDGLIAGSVEGPGHREPLCPQSEA